MPSVSGWRLQRQRPVLLPGGVRPVSMPSVSGWRLQPRHPGRRRRAAQGRFYALGIGLAFAVGPSVLKKYGTGKGFLCPRYRAGVCSRAERAEEIRDRERVSMPSVSGWRLQLERTGIVSGDRAVSMPSVSGWRLQVLARPPSSRSSTCFYALGIGLAFAALLDATHLTLNDMFLCPRYRAGVCRARHI